ncbi:hypothetical protein [Piscinibacter gummiphilus]|uniref:hypothetical protein n=1 Tax=Piscinibacter gummiphilus TaxID=946333 RepID=UPI0012F51C63|nr:hypothetical protein [Piscinibacter gummiphilus]
MAADFKLSRIVIVESLEAGEVRTGLALSEFIKGLGDVIALELPVEYRSCESKGEFLEVIVNLSRETWSGNQAPLLHIESHGDPQFGLEFANSSLLSWDDLSSALVQLNKASRFNLVCAVAACYGAYFLDRFSTIDPAPCYALVAPNEAVDSAELMAGFRDFYRIMFQKRDAGLAVDTLLRRHRTRNVWFAQLAEGWYEHVSVGYVKAHCTKPMMRERCQKLLRKLRSEGDSTSMGKLKRMLSRLNRTELVGKHFNTYFMTDEIPENIGRFQHVRTKVAQEVASLRATGRYLV